MASLVKVKICGITNIADAESAEAAGADMLGFNFYPPSPRYVNVRAASEISRRTEKKSESVGVFVNASVDEVINTTIEAHLDAVQLHGDETSDYCKRLRERLPASCSIIKAVRVKNDSVLDDLKDFPADALLLDAWQPGIYGGTGRTIDFVLARRARQFTAQLFLAGGLTPQNVAEAVRVVRPYAVDVCSGVEAAPGRKSHAEIAEFIREVRRASAELVKDSGIIIEAGNMKLKAER